MASLNIEDIHLIRELAAQRIPFIEIGIPFGVSKKKIRNVVTSYGNLKPRRRLYMMQEGLCYGCQENVSFDQSSIDHIIPKSKGGRSDYSNYQMLCKRCNVLKSNKDMQYLYERLDVI